MKIENLSWSDKGELLCPGCGREYLRAVKVEAFDRSSEDMGGVHVTVSSGKATVDNVRKEGVKVFFTCETCNCESVLMIMQHKGTTYITHHALKNVDRIDVKLSDAKGSDSFDMKF